MTITIYAGYHRNYVLLGSKDPRFRHAWGSMRSSLTTLYEDMCQIAFWCNNTIGEECLFEVE